MPRCGSIVGGGFGLAPTLMNNATEIRTRPGILVATTMYYVIIIIVNCIDMSHAEGYGMMGDRWLNVVITVGNKAGRASVPVSFKSLVAQDEMTACTFGI